MFTRGYGEYIYVLNMGQLDGLLKWWKKTTYHLEISRHKNYPDGSEGDPYPAISPQSGASWSCSEFPTMIVCHQRMVRAKTSKMLIGPVSTGMKNALPPFFNHKNPNLSDLYS